MRDLDLIYPLKQLFWKNLTPQSSDQAKAPTSGLLFDQITKDFGSVENLKTEFNTKTAGIQGSGWGWLGYDKAKGKLEVVTTANQDPLLSTSRSPLHLLSFYHLRRHPMEKRQLTYVSAHAPIIGIDIWEHAFYLQYKNVKPDVSLGHNILRENTLIQS
jgi:Fe-Mn family superoxide dismutase